MDYLHEETSKFQVYSDICFQDKILKMNFTTYNLKQKTTDVMCKYLTWESKSNDTVIAFGDGDFNTSFGFKHKASPKSELVTKRLVKVHKQSVVMINEFNTSQVCSKCLSNKKIKSLDDKSVNSHFVKRCQSCFTIWNRDINSSRHMIDLYLHEDRPDVLRTRLCNINNNNVAHQTVATPVESGI